MADFKVKDLIITGTEDAYQSVLFGSLIDVNGNSVSVSNTPYVEAFPQSKKSLIIKDVTTAGFSIAMSKVGLTFNSILANLLISDG